MKVSIRHCLSSLLLTGTFWVVPNILPAQVLYNVPDAGVFPAVLSYSEADYPINTPAYGYDIQCDIQTHDLLNTKYGFGIYLATPIIHSVVFHGPLNGVEVFQPFQTASSLVSGFADDQLYHIDITVDVRDNFWSVAIDGTQLYAASYAGSDLQDVNFVMDPVYATGADAPGTYAILSNLIITATPEPSSLILMSALLAVWLLWSRLPRSSRNTRPPL